MTQLTGRVALVTGAGRGIGRATALALASAGAAVVATARSVDELDSVVEEIRAAGGERGCARLRPLGPRAGDRARRAGGGAVRADRHPRQQRGHRQQRRSTSARGVRRRVLGSNARDQPDGSLHPREGGPAAHALERLRPHHHRRLDQQPCPLAPRRRLRRQQAWRAGPDAHARARARSRGDHRQLRLPWPGAHAGERPTGRVRRGATRASIARSTSAGSRRSADDSSPRTSPR